MRAQKTARYSRSGLKYFSSTRTGDWDQCPIVRRIALNVV